MIKNLQAAKELLAHYKSITLAQLELEWNDWEDQLSEFGSVVDGGDVMSGLTGFGTTGSCTLCQACNTQCHHCLYSLLSDYDKHDYACLDKTYHLVSDATSFEELYRGLQFRIERLEKAIELCENGC